MAEIRLSTDPLLTYLFTVLGSCCADTEHVALCLKWVFPSPLKCNGWIQIALKR